MATSNRPITKGVIFTEAEWKEVVELMQYSGLNFSSLVRSVLREKHRTTFP